MGYKNRLVPKPPPDLHTSYEKMKTNMVVRWNPMLKRHGIGSMVEGAKEIAAWLSDDLTRGQDSINDWITKFNAVATGELEGGYLGTGNAHHVRAVGEHVFIECEHADDMKVFLTRAQIVEVLRKYSTFLATDVADASQPPETFEIEFEADRELALDCYLAKGGKLGV